MRKTILTAAAIGTLFGAVSAQDLALKSVENDDMMVEELGMSVGDLDGMAVLGADGQKIGEVESVLERPDGVATSVAVEAGGFLGLGAKEIVVPLNALKAGDEGLTTTLSEEEIGVLPEFQG